MNEQRRIWKRGEEKRGSRWGGSNEEEVFPGVRVHNEHGPQYYEQSAELREKLAALDAAIVADISDLPPVGPSVPLGQARAQQVVHPGEQQPVRSTAEPQTIRTIPNELLVQHFRQTSGE